MKFTNSVAIITGAASGMGAETAKHLAQAGAKVALFDIDIDAAERMAKTIDGFAVACDVSDAASVEQAVSESRKVLGAARILINCAGIAPAKRIVGKQGPMPLDEFSRVININLVGTFNTLRVAAADMMKLEPLGDSQERGVIINTASIAAFEGQIGQAAYSAAKGGVVAMTLPAAREFAKFGIRVLAIAPGLVETPMFADMPQDVRDSLAAQTPFPKRLAKPSEYATLAMHLIENEMMNGTVVRLDGAMRMQAS